MSLAHESGPVAPTSNRNAVLTGVDRRTLDAIYRHPLAHNLSWREVVSLITAIGGPEEKGNGEFVFQAGEERLLIKRPHAKDLTTSDVIDLRHFLTRAGWSPGALDPPAQPVHSEREAQSRVIVIDHAGAKVYDLEGEAGGARTASDPRRLLHHVERKQHDADRDETYPADTLFFDQVAAAVASGGPIVVIGHGTGQSNEADHLTAYLKRRYPETYLRIVKEIVADLPGLTTPELLQLGRHALLAD